MLLNTRRHVLRLIALAALVLAFVSSCGTKTSVTQIWQAPGPQRMTMKSIIVFGTRMDEANRRALEDGLVAELARHDITARPSYDVFPGELPEREQARAAVQNSGFEGILMATLRSVKEQQTYVPGYTDGFWAGYGSTWAWGYPGYVYTDEIVNFETTLWDTRAQDKLAFAMSTKTTNPSSGTDFVKSLTKAVIPELQRANLIPPKRGG
jgi:hypothetical protein